MKQYYINVYNGTLRNKRDRVLADEIKKLDNSLANIDPDIIYDWVKNLVQEFNLRFPRCCPLDMFKTNGIAVSRVLISVHPNGRSDMPVVNLRITEVSNVINSEENL